MQFKSWLMQNMLGKSYEISVGLRVSAKEKESGRERKGVNGRERE